MSARFRPPPLARFYSDAESDHAAALVVAREQGFADGRAAGLLEGHAAAFAEGEAQAWAVSRPEIDALRDALAKREKHDAVAKTLERMLALRDADVVALEITVRDLAVTALRVIFPILLSHAAGAEIAAQLADALTERAPEALSLRAHPDTLAAVATETAASVEAGRLALVSDPRLPIGAAEFGWTGGGTTFDPEALLARVTSLLAPVVTAEPRISLGDMPDPRPVTVNEASPQPEASDRPDADGALYAAASEPSTYSPITETSP